MRNLSSVLKIVSKFDKEAIVHHLKGECLGIECKKDCVYKIKYAVHLLGYSFLLPHEYEYSFKEKPKGAIIIF